MPFNNVDYFILFLSLFSIYQSAKNGLITEIISGISFILALTIAYIFGSHIEEKVMAIIGVKFLSMVISYALVFIILLSLFYYIMNLIFPSGLIKTANDRILGAVFGVLKFFCLLLIFSYFINLIFPVETQPAILKESFLKNLTDSILNTGILQNIERLVK